MTGQAFVGCPDRPPMRMAALLVALFTVVVGVVGLVSPASLTAVRRQYFATPTGLLHGRRCPFGDGTRGDPGRYGLSCAKDSALVRRPDVHARTFGHDPGPEHARTVLEWETMRPALLRAGAIVALASGVFMVFAVTTGRRPTAISQRPLPSARQTLVAACSEAITSAAAVGCDRYCVHRV